MLYSSAQCTAAAAPHDPRVPTVGSAQSVMPVGQADGDDADNAIHHGDHGGVPRWTMQPEPVTVLKPMCIINMTPEGAPQVALAASQASTSGQRGYSPPYPSTIPAEVVSPPFDRRASIDPENKSYAQATRDGISKRAAAARSMQSKWNNRCISPSKEVFATTHAAAFKKQDEELSPDVAAPALHRITTAKSPTFGSEMSESDLEEIASLLADQEAPFPPLCDYHALESPFESKLAEKVVQAGTFSPGLNLPIKKRILGPKKRIHGLSLSDESSSTPSSGASTPLGLQAVPAMSPELPDGGAGLIKPNVHRFMNCGTPEFGEDAPVRGEGTPVHDKDAPVHDKDTSLHAPDHEEMVVMLHGALQQMQGEETLQGEENPRAPLYMFSKGNQTFKLATEKGIDLPGLLTLWQRAQSQKEQFSLMAASLMEVTKGYPTQAELQVAVCCLISTTTLQPILNVDLKPDSRITTQLTSIYLKLVGPTYTILEKVIKLEEVIQSLAALIIASLQLVMQAEAGFNFDTGSAVPRSASQLKHYFEANAKICSVLGPQYSLIRKVFMSTYDELLNASNRYVTGLEHLFAIDPEATRTLLVLDHLQRGEHWPRPGPEETRTDPNLTPA